MIIINHYEVLNIPKDSDKITIKRAYFSLVKVYTPDKEPDKFRIIREAYDTLFDDRRRAQYDGLFSGPDYLQDDLVSVRELIRQSKLKQAIETLIVMVRNHPDEDEVSKLLAHAYNKNRNNGKAQKICEALLLKNPEDVDTLLLLANVYADRNYIRKAESQYIYVTKTYPEKREAWVAYIQFLLGGNHYGHGSPYSLNTAVNKALQVSEDMFKDEYELYMHCACYIDTDMSFFDHLFGETSTYAPDSEKYFTLFVRFFVADMRPTLGIYNTAVKGLDYFVQKGSFFPCMESLLAVLLDSGHRQPHHDKTLRVISNSLSFNELKTDKRIKAELIELVELLVAECDCDNCKHNRTVLEHNIVFEMASSRRQIIVLREHYPDLFKLNEAFYLDVLNSAKESALQAKYRAEARRYEKTKTKTKKSGMDAMDIFDEYNPWEDDDWDIEPVRGGTELFEPQAQPFVRESPKIGRNDPCPCGSGKKYKKCCGAVSV